MPENFEIEDEAVDWVPLGEAVMKVLEEAEAAMDARLIGRAAA